jgi:hypothetical protein
VNKLTPNVLLSLVALLSLLVLGVAVAQQDMGNSPVPGATFTTGTVRAVGPDSVTIEKDSGETVTLLLNAATVGSERLVTGSRVRIDFHTNEYAQGVADVIQAGESEQVQVASEPIEEPAPIVAPPAASEPIEEPVVAAVTESPDQEALPATASNLPAFLLSALIALAAAVALRLAR